MRKTSASLPFRLGASLALITLACNLPGLIPSPPPTESLAEQAELRLHIWTTSDWTTLGVSGATLSEVQILGVSAEATNVGYDENSIVFTLNQPLDRAGGQYVEMFAYAVLTDVNCGIPVFTIDGGHIGATKVEIVQLVGSSDQLVGQMEWSGSSQHWQSFNLPITTCEVASSAPTSRPTSGPTDVLIPPTTKVLDEKTQFMFERMDPNGTMYFTYSTPALAALAPGDVLVSDAIEAAPYGLLRKVRLVRAEGDKVVVETDGALLTEAIHRGQASITRELRPEDVRSVQILQPGVSYRDSNPAPRPQAHYASLLPQFQPVEKNEVFTFDFNTDLGTGGKIQMMGNAGFSPILEFDANISCDETVDLLFGEVCKEIPDLNLLARVGIEQSTSLIIKGNSGTGFNQKYPIANLEFSKITLMVGPVPVVLVPILTVYLQGDGSLSATLDYSVEQRLVLAAGFRYNSDHGFEDLSEKTSDFARHDPTFTGQVEGRAVVGVEFKVLVYGIIGPFGSLEGGVHLQANLAGLSFDKNVTWKVEGCLWLNVGIDSVDVLDIHYQKELWKMCVGFAQGENRPPSVSIQAPADGSQMYEGELILLGSAVDFDGGPLTCRWTSSDARDRLRDQSCNQATITFAGLGTRTLTLTATDPSGASASDSISVTINPLPPTPVSAFSVKILSPANGTRILKNETVNLTGQANGGVTPYVFKWTIAYPTDTAGYGGTIYTIGSGQNYLWKPLDTLVIGCGVNTFGRITLEATDANGNHGYASIVVTLYCRIS